MRDFLLLEETAPGAARAVLGRLRRAPGVSVRALGVRLWLVRRRSAPAPLRVLAGGGGFVIGGLHVRRTGTPAPDVIPAPFGAERAEALAARLCAGYFGAYVAYLARRGEAGPALFRDPSGALDCLTWRLDGLRLAADALEAPAPTPTDARPDPRALAALLAEPVRLGGALPLTGVRAVGPGGLAQMGDGARAIQIWTPAQAARDPAPDDPASTLRAAVTLAVRAVAGDGTAACELSGGLDSSIVAGALGGAALRGALHVRVPDPAADELGFAEAAARLFGIRLLVLDQPDLTFAAADLDALPTGARPSLAGFDPLFDAAVAAACAQIGADRLLTGQGGDAVFLQGADPDIAADILAGPRRAQAARLRALALWTGVSAPRLWIRGRLGGARVRPVPSPAFLARSVRADLGRAGASAPAHPWLEGCEGLAPAKRTHVLRLAEAQVVYGPSRRAGAVRLHHPLLSQPVLEAVLPLSALQLTDGARDRALARAAFAERLPETIVARRSKGDMTAYYGRALARSAPVLRPFLLDGAIAALSLLDRTRLDAALTADALAIDGGYAGLVRLICAEAWARRWSASPGA